MRLAARRRLAAATIAGALTLVLAGCGGGGTGGDDSEAADRYRAQADTICQRFEERDRGPRQSRLDRGGPRLPR